MRKRKNYVLYLLLMAVFVLSSCSKSSPNAKFIPEDAVVVSIDVKQIFEKSKLGDNEDAKKELLKAIKENADSKRRKDLLQAIVENPAKAGIDLREPIFFFTDKEQNNALVGSVLDKNDFSELLSTLTEEKVKEKEGLMYLEDGRNVIVFDDATFYFSEDRELNDIVKLFKNDDTQNTMAENDDFAKLLGGNGLVKMLVPLSAYGKYADAAVKKNLPDGAKLEDLSILMNLNSGKGNITMSVEVLAKSDAWKDSFKKSADICEKIDGDYLKYLKKGALLLYTNIDGEELYETLVERKVFKEIGAEGAQDMVKKVLNSIDGDCVINVGELNLRSPEFTAYIKTKDGSLIDLAEEFGMTSRGGIDFGFKDGTSYVAMGDDAFKEAKNTYDKSAIKGHRFYFYCDAEIAGNFSDLPYSYRRSARELSQYLSAIEVYDTGTTSCDFVLKLKNEDKDALEFLGELILENIN